LNISSDGNKLIVASSNSLEAWDLERMVCDAKCRINIHITSIAGQEIEHSLLLGTLTGEVLHMNVLNLGSSTPIITAIRLWNSSGPGTQGSWAQDLTGLCPGCGGRFRVPGEILDVIYVITCEARLADGLSPCLHLPDEAWDEPKLLSECPNCGGKLKFNPFVVDNRDRY
jgi:hypothetical protein